MTVQDLIGHYCIVRDNMSGVVAGTLTAIDVVAGTWEMGAGDARKIHFWCKAAATPGLAAHGPGAGSRICPVQPLAAGRALVEPLLVSAEAEQAIRAYPDWRP